MASYSGKDLDTWRKRSRGRGQSLKEAQKSKSTLCASEERRSGPGKLRKITSQRKGETDWGQA